MQFICHSCFIFWTYKKIPEKKYSAVIIFDIGIIYIFIKIRAKYISLNPEAPFQMKKNYKKNFILDCH